MRIAILTTGGTIEKTYNELKGQLRNHTTILQEILEGLRLPDTEINHIPVLKKDSLDMDDNDRLLILNSVRDAMPHCDGVIILHGTDTLTVTGELLHQELKGLDKPVILTGAMRPFPFRNSDALQNVTESLLAARLVPPGVYTVIHNKVLPFPNVKKDYDQLTFVKM